MSKRTGLFCLLGLVFLMVARDTAAQSNSIAQIRATATVIMPIGFYDNSPETLPLGQDATVIDFCYPAHSGIIIAVNGDKGVIERFRFPSEDISRADNQTVLLERAVLSLDDYCLQDSCLITIIYSEN